MEKQEIRKNIIEALETVGVLVDGSEEDVCLLDYDIESITFIAFIVELENRFCVQIPDKYFNMDLLLSLVSLCNLMELLVSEKNISW